jgi:Mrp family chromosome partitioning ATPase
MARMLQALKNLEARAAWPAAGAGVLSHLSESAQQAAPPVESFEPPPPPPAAPLPQFFPPPTAREPEPLQFAAPSAIVVQSPERFDAIAGDAIVVNSFDARETMPQREPERPPPRPTTRPPTGAERAVRRTLGEPHRRQPLADLAARLREDAHKTGSGTLLLVGVGPESSTHETALHLASVLADDGGRVLLVDGDLARRQISADLDDLQEPGLSNLGQEGQNPQQLVQPTAVERLSLLPAGTERFADLESSAGVVARSLGVLAAEFDLVLVDGGRVGDPGLPLLARLCDATYLVIQLGAVEAAQAQNALRDLRAGGARVLGCIATGGDA